MQEQLAQLLPKNELVVEYMSVAEVREKYDSLKMEIVKIEAHIKQLQDALDNLLRLQQRFYRLHYSLKRISFFEGLYYHLRNSLYFSEV